MPFVVRHKSMVAAQLAKKHPGAHVVDLTSKAPEPWIRFSPFFPHGGIPVPFTPGRTAASVEGIWQGLKVFESTDVDEATLANERMRGLKRTVRRFGPCLGHRRGLHGADLLGYVEARWVIYLPTYRWLLSERLADEVAELRALEAGHDGDVVLLDYAVNEDPDDPSRPLSHAGLVRAWLEDRWPERP